MDEDLKDMPNDKLIEEIKKLREGIRKHRDSSGHDLCWFHPQLWNLLPEKYNQTLSVPLIEIDAIAVADSARE